MKVVTKPSDISIGEDVDLDAELNDVAGHLNAQYGRLVDLTIVMLADKPRWQGPGVWTPEQFPAWRVGIAPHRARQVVEIAERADELPECLEALRRGELSIDQVAPIAKRVPWWADSQVSVLAKNLTVMQLRRVHRAMSSRPSRIRTTSMVWSTATTPPMSRHRSLRIRAVRTPSIHRHATSAGSTSATTTGFGSIWRQMH